MSLHGQPDSRLFVDPALPYNIELKAFSGQQMVKFEPHFRHISARCPCRLGLNSLLASKGFHIAARPLQNQFPTLAL